MRPLHLPRAVELRARCRESMRSLRSCSGELRLKNLHHLALRPCQPLQPLHVRLSKSTLQKPGLVSPGKDQDPVDPDRIEQQKSAQDHHARRRVIN